MIRIHYYVNIFSYLLVALFLFNCKKEENVQQEYWWENKYIIENDLDYAIVIQPYFKESLNTNDEKKTIPPKTSLEIFNWAGIGENNGKPENVFNSIEVTNLEGASLFTIGGTDKWQDNIDQFPSSETVTYTLMVSE